MNLSWSSDRKTAISVLIYMMERLGGKFWRYYKWEDELERHTSTDSKTNEFLTEHDITEGFKHIREEAPRGNFDGEQLEWLAIQKHNPKSLCHRLILKEWGLVKELLNKLNAKQNLATKETYYPLLWGDVSIQAQKIMKLIIPLLLTTTVLLVGEAGFAKTPLNMIVAFMLARYHSAIGNFTVQAAVRMAAEIDFFRGEAGQKEVPCVFDDGDLWEQRIKLLKAFFDPTKWEAMVYARWGAAKFVRGQARFAADNTYNPAAVPSNEDWLKANTGTQENRMESTTTILLDMILCAFPKDISRPNIMAMLKRVSIVLNTDDWIFYRLAGTKQIVTREVAEGHYITPTAGDILNRYVKNDTPRDRDEHERLLAEETEFVQQVMSEAAKRKTDFVQVKDEPVEEAEPASEMHDWGRRSSKPKWARIKSKIITANEIIDLDPESPVAAPAAAPAAAASTASGHASAPSVQAAAVPDDLSHLDADMLFGDEDKELAAVVPHDLSHLDDCEIELFGDEDEEQ